jgi:hypothetical protein
MITKTCICESAAPTPSLLLAFELGQRSWKLGFSVGMGQRPRGSEKNTATSPATDPGTGDFLSMGNGDVPSAMALRIRSYVRGQNLERDDHGVRELQFRERQAWEPTRRQTQEPQERHSRAVRHGMVHRERASPNGTNSPARSTARRSLVFASPWGRRSCVNANPELRNRASASRSSAVSFFTRRRSLRTSCWSSSALRSVTSRPTTTLGALSSHPRAVERGPRGSWRWSRPSCVGRDPEAGGRSAAEGEPCG